MRGIECGDKKRETSAHFLCDLFNAALAINGEEPLLRAKVS
jgi:hypothetical protein